MNFLRINDVGIHFHEQGERGTETLVFSNSLGTDLRVWDAVVELLPSRWHIIRYDKRGHGLSECPPGPYSIQDLANDAVGLLGRLGIERCLFVGLSIGGLIGQQIALSHPQLVRGLILSNTATRIGAPEMWAQRISMARSGRLDKMSASILERWFSAEFRATRPEESQGWGRMLARTPAEGYAGCCEAIRDSDLTDLAGKISVPVRMFAGTEDGATPTELVASTCTRIPGATMEMFEGAGHLPCVENPVLYAERIIKFAREVDRH